MRIVLLDDSGAHNNQMCAAIQKIAAEAQIPIEIVLQTTRFDDVLAYAAENPPATVYFLDIQLSESRTGLDLCRALRRDSVRDRFIFVSAYAHFALECLNLHAYDFLLKPVDPIALRDCLKSVYRDMQTDTVDMLDIQMGSRTIRLPSNQVYYLEAEGRNVIAHTERGDFTYLATLTVLTKELESRNFVQVHRKYLVNRLHIQELDNGSDTVLVHGVTLPVSRRMRNRLFGKEVNT